MILIKNVHVFGPEDAGVNDLLLLAGKIVSIGRDLDPNIKGIEIIDGKGKIMVPGFIDAHIHIDGAGGEGGPSTRTPEVQLQDLVAGGITSVVGCLGTDGITRDPASVLMKAKSLRSEGISAWMYTGAYQVPTPTILGDPAKDLAMIDEVIGVGEIALSDHRSSHPDTYELIRLAAQARVGGMLGGKAGIVNIHMGDAKDPFRPIHDAVKHSELNYKQFFPTHINRNEYIFEDAKEYGQLGWIDITTSSYPFFKEFEIKPSVAFKQLIDAGVPPEHITMTSDGNGSLPHFNEAGELVRLECGAPVSMLYEFRDAVLEEGVEIPLALMPFTLNPANILKLKQKGRISTLMDADMVILNKELHPEYVFAGGQIMMREGSITRRGTYSK